MFYIAINSSDKPIHEQILCAVFVVVQYFYYILILPARLYVLYDLFSDLDVVWLRLNQSLLELIKP